MKSISAMRFGPLAALCLGLIAAVANAGHQASKTSLT